MRESAQEIENLLGRIDQRVLSRCITDEEVTRQR